MEMLRFLPEPSTSQTRASISQSSPCITLAAFHHEIRFLSLCGASAEMMLSCYIQALFSRGWQMYCWEGFPSLYSQLMIMGHSGPVLLLFLLVELGSSPGSTAQCLQLSSGHESCVLLQTSWSFWPDRNVPARCVEPWKHKDTTLLKLNEDPQK